MSAKPSVHAEWDTNNTNVSATTAGHKSDGWANNEIPTAAEFNHWQKQVSDWTKWLYDGSCQFADFLNLTWSGQTIATGIADVTLANTGPEYAANPGNASTLRLTYTGGGSNLGALSGISGGTDGRELTVICHTSTSASFPVNSEDSGATAANRIVFTSPVSGFHIDMSSTIALKLRYNGQRSRWMVIGVTPGAGFARTRVQTFLPWYKTGTGVVTATMTGSGDYGHTAETGTFLVRLEGLQRFERLKSVTVYGSGPLVGSANATYDVLRQSGATPGAPTSILSGTTSTDAASVTLTATGSGWSMNPYDMMLVSIVIPAATTYGYYAIAYTYEPM